MSKPRIKLGQWKTVFKGIFTTVKQAKARYPDGHKKIWEKSSRPPSVAVLAFNQKKEILITREYRGKNKKYEWRVVAGIVDDPRLTLKQHAQKELREEAGFSAGKLKKFIVWHAGGWDLHVFLASDLKDKPLVNDEFEDITLYFMPIYKAYQMCLEHKIKNAHIVASIMLLYHQLKSGKIKI